MRPSPASASQGWLALLALLASAAACDGGAPDPPAAEIDAGDELPPPPNRQRRWGAVETIDRGGVGHQASLAAGPGGAIGVAYFVNAPRNEGPCEALGESPPDRLVWTLRFAQRAAAGWAVEDAWAQLWVGNPAGLQLRYSPEAVPAIATATGEPLVMERYCGANDVGLLRRLEDGWTLETAVSSSGQAVANAPASDFGQVVGHWPALAFGPGGELAIAYKDIHSGSIQGDDLTRADAELAWLRGGAWRYLPVDFGEGAGSFNALTFDAQGRPVVVYHNPVDKNMSSRHGLWVARYEPEAADPADPWIRLRLFEGLTTESPSVLAHPGSGELLIAYYNGAEGRPYLARLSDPDRLGERAGWTLEPIGDNRYDEGYHPSLAVDPQGRIAVAWYRCGRSAATLGQCDPDDDAVVFAWLPGDGDGWQHEIVDAGGEAICGRYPGLVFEPGGAAIVAYQCGQPSEGGFELNLLARRREALR